MAAQAVKAALAACVAWAVAGWWLRTPSAFVAPWVAVVLVESTVFRSIAHGLQQCVHAATGALFVLTTAPVTIAGSAIRIAEAVFGALVGIAVNALIRPPVYLRGTRVALEDAAREAQQILYAVADRLTADTWDARTAEDLHERALRLPSGPGLRRRGHRARLRGRPHHGRHPRGTGGQRRQPAETATGPGGHRAVRQAHGTLLTQARRLAEQLVRR